MKKLLTAALLCLASSLPTMAQKAVIVEPEIQAGGYTNLNAALKAVNKGESDTYIVTINKNIEGLSETIIAGSNGDKNITIQGANEDIVVKLAIPSGAESYKMLLNMNSKATGSLIIKNITFDCDNKVTTNDFMAQAAASLTLENVTIKNLIYNGTNASGFRPGMLRLTGNPALTVLNNLRFENCTVEGDNAPYNVMNAMSNSSATIIGEFDYMLALNNGTATITDGGITSENPTIYLTANRTLNKPVVYGTTDYAKFNVDCTDKTAIMLAPAEGNLNAIAKKSIMVINNTDGIETGYSYDNLSDAASKATTNAEIIIFENIDFSSDKALGLNNKTVEIRGINPGITINTTPLANLASAGNENTHLTLKDLTFSWDNSANGNFFIGQANKPNTSVTIRNVTCKNCVSQQSFFRSISDGILDIDGLSFEDCTLPNGISAVTFNNAGNSISGINNNLSITVNNTSTNEINAEGLKMGNVPVKLLLRGTFWHDYALIKNCEDTSLFELTNSGWSLMADNGGIKILENKIVTGVEDVEAEADGTAEYFDLRGQRVAADALAPGFYICRKGGKTTKIVVR